MLSSLPIYLFELYPFYFCTTIPIFFPGEFIISYSPSLHLSKEPAKTIDISSYINGNIIADESTVILLEDLPPSRHLPLLPPQELHILIPLRCLHLAVALSSQLIWQRSRVLTEVYVTASSRLGKKAYSWVGIRLHPEFRVRLRLKARAKEVHNYFYKNQSIERLEGCKELNI